MKKMIEQHKKKIDKLLKVFLDKRINRMKSISPIARELMKHIREFNLRGGKRIRPILVVIGYQACGGKSDNIINAALAVELMESYLLIHDDIMDQDELRRGYLTMHKVYEAKCKRCLATEPKRYGESMAMISGDILAVLGTEAILESDFPAKRKLAAVKKFNKAVINTCIGQAIDVRASCDPAIQEDQIRRMYDLKTAIYTLEAPLHIGAILAGATSNQLQTMSEYALPLGRAFQLHDDILGLFGTKQKIGKPVGSDLREGKKTVLLLETLKRASAKDRRFIESNLGRELSTAGVEKIKKIIVQSGALDIVNSEALECSKQAKKALNTKLQKKSRKFLMDLADYIVTRKY